MCAGKLAGVRQGKILLKMTSSANNKCRCKMIPRPFPSGLKVDLSTAIMPANKSSNNVCVAVFGDVLPPIGNMFCAHTPISLTTAQFRKFPKGVNIYFRNFEEKAMSNWFITTIRGEFM